MKKVIIKTKAVEENKKCKEWDDNLLDKKSYKLCEYVIFEHRI